MSTVLIVGIAIVAGMLFLAVELFIVPGFSVPGIAGVLLLAYAVYRAYSTFGFTGASVTVLIGGAASFLMIYWALKSRALKSFSLEETQKGSHAGNVHSELLGKTGRALTDLRPAGTAEFEGQRYDVVTDGEYIDELVDIEVIAIEGSRIIVSMYERR